MSDSKQTFLLDLDIKQFTENALHAKGSIQDIGNAENLGGLVEGLTRVTAGLGIIGAAAFALKTTFDLVFEGEQIKRTNALFEEMAKSIGVAGTKLREDLVSATHGLADDTDVINAANRAIITMGDSAAKLPEIMNLARRITQNFGGDLVERFEQINYAIASGSTRLLKQNGIMIDTDKAIKDYAKSLGVSADMLTEAGRKQAILNATLEYGEKRLKDIKGAENDALTTSQQLKVAIKELGEMFVVAFEKLAGPAVRSFLKGFSDMAKEVKNYISNTFGTGAEQIQGHLYKVRQEIKLLEDQLASLEKNRGRDRNWFERMLGIGGNIDEKISEAKKKLVGLKKELTDAEKQESVEKEKSQQQEAKSLQENQKHVTEAHVNKVKIFGEEMRMQQEIIKLQEQHAQLQIDRANSEEELETGRLMRQEALAEQHQARIAEIEQQWAEKKITSKLQYEQLKAEIDRQYIDQIQTNQDKAHAEYDRMLDNQLRHAQTFSDGFSASSKKAVNTAMGGMTQMGRLGQVTFNTLQRRGSDMFQSFGKAAVDGSMSASEIMKGFFLNALADIAQSQGELYLAMGMVPGQQAYLAAGAALLALSGALRAMAGPAGGGSSSIGDMGGGGGGGGGVYAQSPETTQPQISNEPKRSVTVQVMGHYFETEETKTKLMDIIRDATDATDFKYVQIGHT